MNKYWIWKKRSFASNMIKSAAVPESVDQNEFDGTNVKQNRSRLRKVEIVVHSVLFIYLSFVIADNATLFIVFHCIGHTFHLNESHKYTPIHNWHSSLTFVVFFFFFCVIGILFHCTFFPLVCLQNAMDNWLLWLISLEMCSENIYSLNII